MDASHKIILVINPDIASLRDASRFIDICRTTLSLPKEKILLVINQHDQRDGLSREDIERSLHIKVFAALPWDPRVSLQSINRGVPILMQAQNNSPLRKAFLSMAKALAATIGYKASDIARAKKSMSEVLVKSSHLG